MRSSSVSVWRRYPPHKSVYRPAASQNPGAPPAHKARRCQSVRFSTIQSYRGSQNFEAIGLAKDFVAKYFPKTVTRIEGKTIKDIENDVDYRHSKVYDPLGLDVDITLDSRGDHKERSGKEEHLYNPATIHKLQLATRNGDYKLFKEYSSND